LPVLLVFAVPAPAQIFFKKKAPPPAQRVPELILTLKTEGDERKRAGAAEELRDYDPRMFTEIVPVLIDALHNDKKPSVRLEALNSLARLRPVTQAAGRAIENAAANDDALRVRLTAKSALLKYHLAGYSGSSKTDPPVATQEPPLSDPSGATGNPTVTNPPVGGTKVVPAGPALDVPRPLPKGTTLPPGKAPPPPIIEIEAPGSLPPRPF
jgi:hypothetical protein